MASETEISWTDSTFNPWIGCTNVSAGCDHCYAETWNSRYRLTEWGPHGRRRRTSPAKWNEPATWNRKAAIFTAQHGRRQRVFCASLADVFDNHAPSEWRNDLWTLIRSTPELDWQILTKRPHNILKMLPADWGVGYANVWLGTTTENQTEFHRRWPILATIPAAVRFVSYEPAIGPLRLPETDLLLDWLIVGGESGPGARPLPESWVRDIIADCRQRGVVPFLKQWGSYRNNPLGAKAKRLDLQGKGGCLLDGRLMQEFPIAGLTFR